MICVADSCLVQKRHNMLLISNKSRLTKARYTGKLCLRGKISALYQKYQFP